MISRSESVNALEKKKKKKARCARSPRGVARARAAAALRRRAVSTSSPACALRRRGFGCATRRSPGDPGGETTSARVHQSAPRTRTPETVRPARLRRLRVVPAHRLRRGEPPRSSIEGAPARTREPPPARRRRRRDRSPAPRVPGTRLSSLSAWTSRNRRSRSCPRSDPLRVERGGARRRAARRRRRRGRPRRRRRRPKREALAFARRFCLGVAALLVARLHDAGRRRLALGGASSLSDSSDAVKDADVSETRARRASRSFAPPGRSDAAPPPGRRLEARRRRTRRAAAPTSHAVSARFCTLPNATAAGSRPSSASSDRSIPRAVAMDASCRLRMSPTKPRTARAKSRARRRQRRRRLRDPRRREARIRRLGRLQSLRSLQSLRVFGGPFRFPFRSRVVARERAAQRVEVRRVRLSAIAVPRVGVS